MWKEAFPKDIRKQSQLVLNQLNNPEDRQIIMKFLALPTVKEQVMEGFAQDPRVQIGLKIKEKTVK